MCVFVVSSSFSPRLGLCLWGGVHLIQLETGGFTEEDGGNNGQNQSVGFSTSNIVFEGKQRYLQSYVLSLEDKSTNQMEVHM